ncbi:uncharacterized protein BJ171DRAFT_500123 [Polychytrium aggregatum]|uniref:uncharacterized protein n=1 Tax=Polychytrium aggregatum TaxID=110093 RepID=UPI0022FE19C5|nr:uncharacterized protein BJ171DRAFT_500123 [Polychytrium aggregatum]KAI9205923.1 hypothetical protein BJ171DRAFT_500123 [Polychytrium aggregatum]
MEAEKDGVVVDSQSRHRSPSITHVSRRVSTADGVITPGTTTPRRSLMSKLFLPGSPSVHEIANSTLDDNPYVVQLPSVPGSWSKASNYIRTTKYTLLSFLPLTLYYQFHRFYNIYFLLGALSVISKVSSLSPITQISPLIFVLGFTAAKEAIEDYSRYKADKEANNQQVFVIRDGQKLSISSMNVQRGDVIFMEKGSKVPVDCILVSTSFEDGTCFIETAELDGETNLKRKSAPTKLNHWNTPQSFVSFRGRIECEHPNEHLTTFEGRIILPDAETQTPSVTSLSAANAVLRGAVIRNTDWVYAVVVYTGNDTKIMKNLKQTGGKTSTMERKLNYLVLVAFAYNAVLLVSSVMLEYSGYISILQEETAFMQTQPNDYAIEWYLGPVETSISTHVFGVTVGFFSIYTYVIPISLFVTIELARLAQAQFIMWDDNMKYDKEKIDGTTEKCSMKVNNSNLNEDLGAIEYIFSDKTGTLTQNRMKLSKWLVNGSVYDEMESPGQLGRALRDPSISPAHKDTLIKFCHTMVLCHTAIPSVNEFTGELMYESQSPDETALLQAINQNEVIMTKRSKSDTSITFCGVREEYPILQILEFSSDRKRMSIITRMPDGAIRLYTKGADNIILARLSPDQSVNPPARIAQAERALQLFSESGLRTLMVAWKELSEQEYATFKIKYDEAEQSLTAREQKIAAVCESIETDMQFLGCTAIEDKLQDEVPETIAYLLKAGIKIWLLTGDKQETAINIGHSSSLLDRDAHILKLNAANEKTCKSAMEEMMQSINQSPNDKFSLVVSGESLTHIFNSGASLPSLFLSIGVRCDSVICCRVTPLQKALVVKLVRSQLKKVTLSIGDGANDVSMIQCANVGVGIMGREGTQAVRAADYAIGEFRFLKRLMAVHGRYSYMRFAALIFYSFYKNLAFITVQWWYGFESSWSAMTAYEEVFFTLFNIVFTFFPPLVLSLYEKDVSEKGILKYPELYTQLRAGLYWNWTWFATVGTSMAWHAFAIFGSVYMINYDGTLAPNGHSTGYWIQCYLFGTPVLLTVLLKHSLQTKRWTWLTLSTIAFSLLSNVAVMFIIDFVFNMVEYGTSEIQHVLPAYWLTCLLMPVCCVLPDLICIYMKRMIWPSDPDIIMEEEKLERSEDPPSDV